MQTTRSRLRPLLWGAAFALLLVPATAMLLTGEVAWGPEDFVAMATLLLLCGLLLEATLRVVRGPRARIAAGAAVLLVFIATWAHLAVGVVPGLPGGS